MQTIAEFSSNSMLPRIHTRIDSFNEFCDSMRVSERIEEFRGHAEANAWFIGEKLGLSKSDILSFYENNIKSFDSEESDDTASFVAFLSCLANSVSRNESEIEEIRKVMENTKNDYRKMPAEEVDKFLRSHLFREFKRDESKSQTADSERSKITEIAKAYDKVIENSTTYAKIPFKAKVLKWIANLFLRPLGKEVFFNRKPIDYNQPRTDVYG